MNILPLSPTSMSCSLTSWESPAAEYVELGVSLDSILVNTPNATYLAYANGDSMENVGIYSGDLLVIDRKRLCFRTQPTLSFDVIRRLGSSRAYQAG